MCQILKFVFFFDSIRPLKKHKWKIPNHVETTHYIFNPTAQGQNMSIPTAKCQNISFPTVICESMPNTTTKICLCNTTAKCQRGLTLLLEYFVVSNSLSMIKWQSIFLSSSCSRRLHRCPSFLYSFTQMPALYLYSFTQMSELLIFRLISLYWHVINTGYTGVYIYN